jgi:hypothetical protein
MKRITVFALLTAALISMGGVRAHAQAPAFKVPFDFTVANKVLPAGTYHVSYATQDAILIQSKDGRFHAMTIIIADDKESYGVGKLIFAKYGNQYFLHEVLCSNVALNVEIPKSLDARCQHRVALRGVAPDNQYKCRLSDIFKRPGIAAIAHSPEKAHGGR